MKLASQLKKILKKKDLSVAQVARVTQVSDKKLYSWLNGSHPSSFDDVYSVARHLGVSLEYLLFDESNFEKVPTLTDLKDELNIGSYEIVLKKTKT